MNDKFIILYEMNHKQYKSDYLTEDELGHKIAYLMRHGACDVRVVVLGEQTWNQEQLWK